MALQGLVLGTTFAIVRPDAAAVREERAAGWLLVLALAGVCFVLGRWLATCLATRCTALRSLPALLRVLFRSPEGLKAIGLSAATLTFGVWSWRTGQERYLLPLVVLATIPIASALQPPLVLALIRSHPTAALTMSELFRVTWPHRVIAFLDPVKSDLGAVLSRVTNLRIRGSDWQRHVEELVKRVPVVVIDCRFASGPLIEEMVLLRREQRSALTTIFLSSTEHPLSLDEPLLWAGEEEAHRGVAGGFNATLANVGFMIELALEVRSTRSFATANDGRRPTQR